jgi:peptidylprolyl isomerase
VSSRAKAAAAEAAKRRDMRRRLGAALGAGVLLIAILGGAVLAGNSGTSSPTTTVAPNASAGQSTTSTTLQSVAGQPCVPLGDPLPAGAPDVPVPAGPPPTDLVKQDLKPGDGAEVVATNTLSVQYIGVSCSTGKIFDSSWSRGAQPASFKLSDVIVGWQQGLVGMKVGGERLLGIPPALAYGTQGRPGIAPDETLWFVVDVISAT